MEVVAGGILITNETAHYTVENPLSRAISFFIQFNNILSKSFAAIVSDDIHYCYYIYYLLMEFNFVISIHHTQCKQAQAGKNLKIKLMKWNKIK